MAIHPSGIGRSSDVGDVKLMYTVIHKTCGSTFVIITLEKLV